MTDIYKALGISPPRRRKRRVSLLKRYTWNSCDGMFNLKEIMKEDNKIFLGVADVEDLLVAELMKRRSDTGASTIFRETSVLCTREKWATWSEDKFGGDEYLFSQSTSSSGLIIEKASNNLIKFDVNSNTTMIRIFGDDKFCVHITNLVEDKFSVVTSHIEWVYGADGDSVNVPLNRERLPIDEMYPFLKDESLGEYCDRYMESSANILLLIGPPGTGKTSFIRGLLAHTNSSAIVSYDAAILDKDSFFAKFIGADESVMVLEDSDAFLKPRKDGNTMMHRFLNVGDGLVTTKGKKLIFSTNLPSVRDIDSALTRPGRCFDILEFKPLSRVDAEILAAKLGGSVPEVGSEFTIAEIFNTQTNKQTVRNVGFI